MFLCRESELKTLNRRYRNQTPECIVIYGRRRVGKTALINEFVADKPTVYFPALKATAQENLEALSKAIYAYTNPNALQAPVFPSFDAAFSEITRLAKQERLVFVIDEFPYLAKADDSIPSRLQHLLDRDWSGSGIFLILCGSSMSFMEKEVLSEKSPLFGRRTAQIRLEPLSYRDAAKFHPELSAEENALIYGITGGVPHYINKLNVNGSIKDALLENFFDRTAYLYEEPDNLLKQELREPAGYNSLITAIAGGAAKLNEISNRTGIDNAQCLKYIKTLSELGIIEKVEPVVDKSKRKTLYRISDNFFRFWYRFVPNNMMAIQSDRMARVYDSAVGSYLSEYMGAVFEQICKQYLTLYAENLPMQIAKIGEWWGQKDKKEVQLDVVALAPKEANTKGQTYLIGSCKYKNSPVGTDELDLIRSYSTAFTTDADTCYYIIFSKGGFTDELKAMQAKGEVMLVTLEEMYSV